MIRSSDSDVVVIAVACFHDLCAEELWISFGSSKAHTYIPAHRIAQNLGKEKARALLAFHSITGCDTTSAFYDKGKK